MALDIEGPTGERWHIPEQPQRKYLPSQVDKLTYPQRGHIYYGVQLAPFIYVLTGSTGTTLQPPLVGIKPIGTPKALFTVLAWDEFMLELERYKLRSYRAPANPYKSAGRGVRG